MSILAIQSSTLKPIHTYNNSVIKSNTKLLAKGYIFLNGYKVRIADTLKDSVKLINKESRYTGIKAKIVKDKIGNERLQLISQKRNVNIYDPSNLLADFIKNRQLGLESNRLIQIIGNSSIGKSVIINYSNEKQKQEIHNPLKLTSNTITELSKIEYLKSPKIVNQILNIAQENAYIEEWIAPNNPYEIYENSDYYKGLVDLFKESDDISDLTSMDNNDFEDSNNLPPIVSPKTYHKRTNSLGNLQFNSYKDDEKETTVKNNPFLDVYKNIQKLSPQKQIIFQNALPFSMKMQFTSAQQHEPNVINAERTEYFYELSKNQKDVYVSQAANVILKFPVKQKQIIINSFYQLTKDSKFLKSSTYDFNAPSEWNRKKVLRNAIFNYLEKNPEKYNELKNNDWTVILNITQLSHYKATLPRKTSA